MIQKGQFIRITKRISEHQGKIEEYFRKHEKFMGSPKPPVSKLVEFINNYPYLDAEGKEYCLKHAQIIEQLLDERRRLLSS